jgi:OOP family OmpA-OmpF porin
MKLFSAILLIVAMVLVIAVIPAFAGYKDQWVKFRTTMTDKPDSKILCTIFMPWPWKCVCAPAVARDSDGDGVIDGIDQCPDTPAGARVDAKGCPMDSDNDGVFDGIDQCPGTPAGARVDAKGCPTDSDNDGVYDGIDQCPGTPAGATVDAKGCPMDSDNDGVYDGIDKCPNTPAGTKVDETGCPVEVKKFIDTGLISTTAILFDLNKATLKPESKIELDKIGSILIQASDLMVEIGGHTDATGSDATNMTLSDARAKAVHDYLEQNFPQIKPENLVAKGYGESKPVASNDTKEGRAKNRRVEFKIVK